MKKLLALLLAAVLIFSFAACGGKDDPEKNKADNDEKIDAQAVIDKELEKAEAFLAETLKKG